MYFVYLNSIYDPMVKTQLHVMYVRKKNERRSIELSGKYRIRNGEARRTNAEETVTETVKPRA
jgi:hypothetical protein